MRILTEHSPEQLVHQGYPIHGYANINLGRLVETLRRTLVSLPRIQG